MPVGLDPFGMPGMSAPFESTEYEFLWNNKDAVFLESIVISSTATDTGNSGNTTTLRKGLLMGQKTSGSEWAQYDPAATDGTQFAKGVLWESRNMLGTGTTAGDKQGVILVAGFVKGAQLINLDYLARRHMAGRFVFDDDLIGVTPFPKILTVKATDYTVTAADNQTLFTTRGAVGTVIFTLPTIARGLEYGFFNEAGQTMTLTASTTDTLVVFNDLAADTISFAQASELIGGYIRIIANDNASKWLVMMGLADENQTIAITT